MKKPPQAPQETADDPARAVALIVDDGIPPKKEKPRNARHIDGVMPGVMKRDAPGQRPTPDIEERRQPQAGGRGTRSLSLVPDSYDATAHTVEAILSAGSAVQRYYFTEELEITEEAIDLTRVGAGVCPLLDTHNQYELAAQIGRVVSARVEGNQLIGVLQFDQTDAGQLIEARVARGELRAISIGYLVTTWQITSTPGSSDNETWRAMSWQLLEASFVPVPADPNAVVRSASGNLLHGVTEEEENMRRNIAGGAAAAAPVSTAAPAAADTTIVVEPGGGTRAEPHSSAGTAAAPVVATTETRAAGVSASRILDMCGRSAALGSDFAAELIRANDTAPLTENDLLGRVNERLMGGSTPRAPINASAGVTGTETEGYRQAVEDAVMLRANPDAPLADMPGRTRDQRIADARELRGMTLMELARDYLGRTGISTGGMSRLDVAGAALGMRSGALTTSDFAFALAAVANKRVRAAFTAAPQTFRPIVSTGTLPDFKPSNIVSLGDAPALLLVPENGEFKRGAISDSGLTYRLQTYGRIIPITRQAIVNDDQNLFGRIPTMFGRKAADLESDLVWGLFLSNPTMADGNALFSVAHGNLAGAGSAITVASLGAGRQAMRQQTSNEGGYLNIAPTYLIVGPAKEVEAQQMLAAVVANQNSAVNPFSGSLTLIVEPRITGNQWFLSTSPDAFDTIELDHLLGQEELFTDTRVGFDVDGVENKARLDVGAALLDFRGFYKNPGN
jgi:phage major head subunit gpT-like protein